MRYLPVCRLVGNMVLHHFIGYKGQPVKFVKGGVKSILITQEIRTGRKTVTKVSGLEHFMIDVDGFGQEIQVLCASSVASKVHFVHTVYVRFQTC